MIVQPEVATLVPEAARPVRRGSPRPLLIVSLIALALYLPGFWWGAPHATAPDRTHAWGVDDEVPLGPLADVYGIFAPRAHENLGYPLMYSLVTVAASAPYLGILWLNGERFQATYPFGLTDPARTLRILAWIAHLLSVLMAVGIVAAAYDAAHRLWDRRTALLAAFFVMLQYPMFYYARTGNVDIPVLFFTALALNAFARILADGITTRRALALGAAVGCALATKESSFGSFLAVAPVVLFLYWRGAATSWTSWRFWRVPLLALGATVLAFAVGSGLLLDPDRYFAHLAFVQARVGELTSGQVAFMEVFPRTAAGHLGLLRVIFDYLVDAMTLPGLLLAVAGIGWTIRSHPRTAAFALPALTYLLVLFWSARAAQLRYIMPAAFTFAFFAARATACGWQVRRSLPRFGIAATAAIALGLSLLRGIDLTHAMINDSRYDAGEWFAQSARAGDRIDYFDADQKLPPLPAGVATERANVYRGAVAQPRIDEAAVREIRRRWLNHGPAFVIIVPDHSSADGQPYSASVPPAIYQALIEGALGYELGAFFQTPALLPWVKRPPLDYPTVNPPIRVFVPKRS